MKQWHNVCKVDALQKDAGVCALVGGKQVAIFYFSSEQAVFAVDNYDPFNKANVVSRGMIGDINGQPMVASPLYKQHFNLLTGVCFEDESVIIEVYPVRIAKGNVAVKVAA